MDPEVTSEIEEGTDSDFESGFETEETQTTTPADPVEDKVFEAEEPAAAAQPSAEDQITALMKRVEEGDAFRSEATRKFDTAFGQLGGMKQALERIQSATPSGQKVEVTEADFSELRAEFPELAELQLKGLKNVFARLQGTGSNAAPVDVDALVSSKVKAVLYERDIESLEDVLPKWQEQVKTPVFSEWIGKQADEIKALAASDSPRDAGKLLRLYRDRPAAPAPKPEISTRQRQLEAAAAPNTARGTIAQAEEDDDFETGFNSR